MIADILSLVRLQYVMQTYARLAADYCQRYDTLRFRISELFAYEDNSNSESVMKSQHFDAKRLDDDDSLQDILLLLVGDPESNAELAQCPHILAEISVAIALIDSSAHHITVDDILDHAQFHVLHDVIMPNQGDIFKTIVNLHSLQPVLHSLAKVARLRVFNPEIFGKAYIHEPVPYSELYPYEPAIERAFGPLHPENDHRLSREMVCVV